MSSEITTVITLAGGIIVAGATYMFTKWREREAEWRREKREHYKAFINSLSDVVKEVSSHECQVRFARACNNLNLIAPLGVIEALKAFQDEIKVSNPSKDDSRHNALMSEVLFEMRRDLNISPRDKHKSFRVRLWSPGTPPDSK